MSKKVRMPEKLIEELGGILYGLYNLVPEVPKGRLIQEAITRVGNAVLSGEYPELDKLLGVKGRAKGYADTKGYDSGFRGQADVELVIDEHDVPKHGISDGDRLEFIVLPPQVAPGEEEGK